MKNFWTILILFCIPLFLLHLFQNYGYIFTQSQIPSEEITSILEEKSLPLISTEEEAIAVQTHLTNPHQLEESSGSGDSGGQLATQDSLLGKNVVQIKQIKDHRQILNHIPCLKCCEKCPHGDKLHSDLLNYNHYHYPKTTQLRLKCGQNAHLQRKCEWVCDCNSNKPIGKCTK